MNFLEITFPEPAAPTGSETGRSRSISRRRFINQALKVTGLLAATSAFGPRLLQAAARPAIFYSPHQDDEAIGMAGAIQEHKAAGHPVYLVLLTNGWNPDLLNIMNGSTFCKWHQTYHKFNLSMAQMMAGRRVEFIASAKQLGVDKLFIANDGQGWDDQEPYTNYPNFVARMVATLKYFEKTYPGAAHRLVSGFLEVGPDGYRNPTHRACWEAARALHPPIEAFKFYRVYVYHRLPANRIAQGILPLTKSWQAVKQKALYEYQRFNPAAKRYALGYHSSPALMEAAASDPHEYYDFLPNSSE